MTSNHTSNNNNDNSNIISDIPNYDFKTVCSKEQVLLKREKSCNIFLLQFNLETKSTDLHDIINIGMYNLLFNLNKENIEKTYKEDRRMDSEKMSKQGLQGELLIRVQNVLSEKCESYQIFEKNVQQTRGGGNHNRRK